MEVTPNEAHKTGTPADPATEDGPSEATVKAVGGWIQMFGRTLKTSRLYAATNPTVAKFRADLAAALARLLDEVGPVTYKFTNDDILYQDVSLHPATSRDDNLALPFHRDGIRAITFSPGIGQREVDAMIDAVMLVTGQAQIEDDLVTLFWQAQLDHVAVDFVPAEGDNAGAAEVDGGALVPWPSAVPQAGAEEDATKAAETSAEGSASRSDDWSTGESTVEIETGFAELDRLAPGETARFLAEFAAEHEVSLMTTALAIARTYLNAGATPADREELARFVPRMLRHAIAEGSWLEAREALAILRESDADGWSVESFAQELLQPISVTTTVERLDRQEPAQVMEFLALARALGEPAVEWLGLALGESQQRRTRRMLADAVKALCRDNPERLAPWLTDSRWYVVRNAVTILGGIGGEPVLGLLRSVMHHGDSRVRRELVAALGQVGSALARPLLLELLSGDARMFSSILHQLSQGRDPETARAVLGFLQDPSFESRPDAEKHAIYAAMSAAGTDDVLPDLEAELGRGGWFSRAADAHRVAIARCIARIGTPAARAVLERSAASKRGAVRDACTAALRSFHVDG